MVKSTNPPKWLVIDLRVGEIVHLILAPASNKTKFRKVTTMMITMGTIFCSFKAILDHSSSPNFLLPFILLIYHLILSQQNLCFPKTIYFSEAFGDEIYTMRFFFQLIITWIVIIYFIIYTLTKYYNNILNIFAPYFICAHNAFSFFYSYNFWPHIYPSSNLFKINGWTF